MKQIKKVIALVLCLTMVVGQLSLIAGAIGAASEDVIFGEVITAGTTYPDQAGATNPIHLVDNVGLSTPAPTDLANTTYAFNSVHCWHTNAISAENPKENAWLLLDLGEKTELEKLYIWNLNQPGNAGRNAKTLAISYSADSTDGTDGTWEALGQTHTVQAPSAGANLPNLIVAFGQAARFVKIQILDAYGESDAYWGLGKVLLTRNNQADPDRAAYLELRRVYNESLLKVQGSYTQDSWAPLVVAQYEAKQLLESSAGTALTFAAARIALSEAMDGLVESSNYALNATVTASEYYDLDGITLRPAFAVDGDASTRWGTNNKCPSATFELALVKEGTINQLEILEYGNIDSIAVEYDNGSGWTAVGNQRAITYKGGLYTVTFDEVTASQFKLTLKTKDPQPGLNVLEIMLTNIPVVRVAVTATNSGDAPAGNLADGSDQTAWLSSGSQMQSVIELDYQLPTVINTITVNEAKDAAAKLTTIQAEYWNGTTWVLLKEVSCEKLPFNKNIFFASVITSKIKLTVNTEKAAAMKINEIFVRNSAPADMPIDTGMPELEPNIVPNEHQALMVERGYTMFIHFGLNTFSENEWSYGDVSPATYTPPQIDADQWVKTAKEAGMKTVLLVTKHHDGFALWDSKYTDYDVGNPESGSHVDVLQAVSDACNKYGINMGIYYSAWDNNWDRKYGMSNDKEYNQYARNQLNEIMDGRYGLKDQSGKGVISELWIDGNWVKAPERWEFGKMYETVKAIQPTCQVGLNWTIGGNSTPVASHKEGDAIYYFPSDFRLGDGHETSDNDPKLFTYRGQTYYLPFEATLILNQSWFWHTGYGSGPSRSPDSIVVKYNKYKDEDNILVLNCGPNREGRIEQADIDSLYAAARKLGIANGDAETPTFLDLESKLYGKNLAKGAVGTSEETYTQEPGYGVEKLFDGNEGTRWATNTGHEDITAGITLPTATTFNTVTLKEDGGYKDRATSAALCYKDGEKWVEIAAQTALKNGRLVFVLEKAVTATELQLLIYSEKKTGPTFTEMELYQVAEMPEIEATLASDALRGGDRAQITVVEKEAGIALNALATYASGNTAVATVDAAGMLTAVAAGETTITVSVPMCGRTLTATILVQVQAHRSGESDFDSTTKTAKNEDGSTSTIVTDKKTGSVTETAKYPDGSKVVTTTPKTGAAQSVITLPKQGEKATVTIPAAQKPAPGMVAVIVKPDGTEEVIKTSVATEGGMKITIVEGATIRLIDNTKTFSDVNAAAWYESAVTFATSRELFTGTSNSSFTPKAPMTRAMLMTVLYRYEGASVKGADETWYADAMAWAKEIALSDGTNPNGSVTREQLATMLYRYAKPTDAGKGDTATFADSDKISDFAAEAMAWSVGTGLIRGKGDQILDPQGYATRAEVAALLMRFCENMK